MKSTHVGIVPPVDAYPALHMHVQPPPAGEQVPAEPHGFAVGGAQPVTHVVPLNTKPAEHVHV